MSSVTGYNNSGMRGDIKLIRGEGHVWANVINKITDGVAAEAITYSDVYMGCLKDSWTLTQSRDTEEIPFSCVTGKFVVDTDKNYTISVATRNIPFELRSALMGLKVYKNAVSGQQVLKQSKITETYLVTDKIDLSGTVGAGAGGLANIHKIVSVYRNLTSEFWFEAAAADSPTRRFKLGAAAPELEFAVATLPTTGETFTIVIQYYEDMAAGDWKAIEDGQTFAQEFDITLSWLATVESGPDKGKVGWLIAKCIHCKPTGDITIGTDTKGIENQTFEFNINFQESGDIELNLHELA